LPAIDKSIVFIDWLLSEDVTLFVFPQGEVEPGMGALLVMTPLKGPCDNP
jgi:hypothetical protein